MIAILFHLSLLFLWCRVWTRDDHAFFFNPHISGPMRVVDRILNALRTPLPFLPNRVLAALALLGVLALKTLAFPRIQDGIPLAFSYGLRLEVWAFLIFTFQIAAIHAVLRLSSRQRSSRAAQTVELVSRPVSFLRPVALQLPAALLGIAVCVLLADVIERLPAAPTTLALLSKSRDVFPWGVALRHGVDILHVWSHCLLLAVLVSWLEIFRPRNYAASCAREYTSFLLGRLSGLLLVGMMDLTPLVAFIVLDNLHRWLAGVLGVAAGC